MVEFERSGDIPENIRRVMEAYRVRPAGMTLSEWYMEEWGPAKPPLSEVYEESIRAGMSKEAALRSLGLEEVPKQVYGGGKEPMISDWDRYDWKAFEAGKVGLPLSGMTYTPFNPPDIGMEDPNPPAGLSGMLPLILLGAVALFALK